MEELKEFYKVIIDDTPYEAKLTPKFLQRKKYVPKDPSKVAAIIPGVVQQIYVKLGQKVEQGDSLLILEAMKMMNTISAPFSGTVKAINAKQGCSVAKGELLIELEK